MTLRISRRDLRPSRILHIVALALASHAMGCGGSDDTIPDLFAPASDAGSDTSLAVDGALAPDTGTGKSDVTISNPTDVTAAPADTTAPGDETNLSDTGPLPDTGTTADAGDTGTFADTGTATDTGIDTGAAADTGTATDSGADGGTPDECVLDSDCATAGKAGQICGLGAPNQCGKCTSDGQCKASSYGANNICNIAAGICIPSACTPTSQACSANSADFCCGVGATVTGTCVTGNCCPIVGVPKGTCPGASDICLNNTCTTCTAATNNTYYVDPVNGSDTSATGSTSCPFKTITRATQYIISLAIVAGGVGNVPAGTKVLLLNKANEASGEQFPIAIPPNVTVSSAVANTPQTIEVTTGRNGLILVAPNSGISSLIIDGLSAALNGIGVTATSISGTAFTPSSTTTTISNVTVTNMRNDGIQVQSGGVLIRQGVLSTKNGVNPTSPNLGAGLHITGGVTVVTVNAAEATTAFNENKGNGIFVQAAGQLTLSGKPDITGYPASPTPPSIANGVGTVTANGNTLANLSIAQTGATPPLCLIDGLVTWKGLGNGMNLLAGSNVVVRNSVSMQNASSGVQITASGLNAPTGINLGNDPLGRNILQGAGVSANKSAGICFGNFANANLTVLAKGNYFNAKDCVVVSAPKTIVNSTRAGCAGAVDVAAELSFGNTQQTNVKATLDNCQSF